MLTRYFATIAGSIRGQLNAEELIRTILTALGSGTVLGVVTLVLTAISDNAAAIFNPSIAGLAGGFIALIAAQTHRLAQGAAVATVPAVVLVPDPEPSPAE